MQCMKLLWFSSIPSQLYKPLDSKPDNPLKFNPRVQLLCSSIPYDVAKTDENENGQNSVKTLPLPSHVKTITSTSNPFVKHCLKLRQSSSYRHSHGSVILVGSTPIRELYRFQNKIEDGLAAIECLLVLDNTNVPEYLNNQLIRHVNVSSLVMKKLSGLQSTDSIDMVALIRIPSTFHSIGRYLKEEDCQKWFPSPYRILVLDGVQDPGNLGTLLRSAMAFRWDGVFLLSDCCDPFNDKALRASRGASFQLPIVSGGWTHLDALRRVFHMKIVAGHPAKVKEMVFLKQVNKNASL
ncbi:uncharacterized protein LOC113778619 isoform X3 [Coffea eugenioides]|uniref:uncharacterized protein LOC113778619 isoform X3 n=1 Tax=Coffea eugenioides TaxID=49369 RepID=UPI000F60EBAA|nr:uncharacterized protein LOC113778619 isoform X3 [Coffea eugenioides]